MAVIRRLAVEVSCPGCNRPNTLLLPEASCGNEFIWHARCAECGGWRWFHSREDAAFVAAVKETARRRNEPGGLSAEGTREAHAAFEATVDPCSCGGRLRVVRDVRDQPCRGCGASLKTVPLPPNAARRIDVPSLRQ